MLPTCGMARLQAAHGDGYWTHPALLDAATHLGAVADTDAVWRDGVPAAARVPVGLGAYTVALPSPALVWRNYMPGHHFVLVVSYWCLGHSRRKL